MISFMAQLTERQIKRQDFVDNQIFELIQSILPPSKKMEWDIEIIGTVRDVIREQVCDKFSISEMRFYPYIKI